MNQQSAAGPQSDSKSRIEAEKQRIDLNLENVRRKILILSGKGGVGKSTVAANLAVLLSLAGKKVGLLDIDIHGPSIPHILNLDERPMPDTDGAILPISMTDNLKVMSVGLFLNNPDEPVIWRGPRKYHAIKQFLTDVRWGELDFLIIDSPPGTGDEPLAIVQLLGNADGAVVVTTPQKVALVDVRKSISFCRDLRLPVLGVLENMSGFICPKCGERTDIFKSGGGEDMAMQMSVPFLGRIPIDPGIVDASDDGQPYVERYSKSKAAESFAKAVSGIIELDTNDKSTSKPEKQGDTKMRIAIPLAEGKLSLHFGHCEKFALMDADPDSKQVTARQDITPPPHEPGVLPKWLHGLGVNTIIAGGMGQRAQNLFAQNDIQVIVGAPAEEPEILVAAHLNQTLRSGENTCDH